MFSLSKCNLLLTCYMYIISGICDVHESFFVVKIDVTFCSVTELWDFCLIQISLCYAGLLKGEHLGTSLLIELYKQTL